MKPKGLSIGELSRRSGVSVKTLRFYSDLGLLPPSGRTASRYRLYDESALVRVEVIRALRDAGLGLDRVGAVLSREVSLAEALRLQLAAVEAHLRSLKHVAAALRAALRSEPTEHDLRRLTAVTRLSNEERRAQIEAFYDRVSEGVAIDPAWKRSMVDASAPSLPDDPTPEQLDAWVELSSLIADEGFIASLRASAVDAWSQPGGVDVFAWKRASDEMVREARAAIDAGVAPDAPEAGAVVDRYFAAIAAAMKRAPDASLRKKLRERFEAQDPRASRYWELVGVLKGCPPTSSQAAEWAWFVAASRAHSP